MFWPNPDVDESMVYLCSFRGKLNDFANDSDDEILDVRKSANLEVKAIRGGSDYVAIVLQSINGNKGEILVYSDDGNTYNLLGNEEISAEEICYANKFGLLRTTKGEVMQIDAKSSRAESVSMIALSIPTKTSIKAVSCGKEHALVLTADQQVLSVGGGSRGQLGNGRSDYVDTLTVVDALHPLKIQAICAGGWHSLVLSDDGDIYGWGWNESGQVGCVSSSQERNRISEENDFQKLYFLPALVQTPIDETFDIISAGSRHSAAITSTGVLYTWGWNGYGQLCQQDQCNQLSPVLVNYFGKRKVIGVSCCDWSTLVSVI